MTHSRAHRLDRSGSHDTVNAAKSLTKRSALNDGVRSAASQTAAPLEALAGTVERVTYHNAENGFAVLKVQTRGKRDLVTVVGHAASVMEGEWITASGSWVSDRTHGVQFKAQTLSATPPTGAQGIEKYLASGPDARHRSGHGEAYRCGLR